MCGRFVLNASPDDLKALFELPDAPWVEPRYNIAPTQPVAIVRQNPEQRRREWALVHWGLIPSWAKDPSIGQKMINARAESIADKPSYRAPFKRRRCLVPATGFYEWKKTPDGKIPYFITVGDGGPFAIAGLWETWHGPDGGELESCTLITTEANDAMAFLHDRMPVIIPRSDYATWLGSGRDDSPEVMTEARHMLHALPDDAITMWPVSTRVNKVSNEGAENIKKVAA